ncbi:MAG: hypothetical protein PF542_05755 [Nanoarchaeota archaeon]|jgi:hypothetical protein|nr:hypothetical protein [Nanoarchaeota archaeon]
MNKIYIESGPEIAEKDIPGEGKYFEIIWKLNETPQETWNQEFDKLIKNHLEIENDLFGPYKPKIMFTDLVLTVTDKSLIEYQKNYFLEEFIDNINNKFKLL